MKRKEKSYRIWYKPRGRNPIDTVTYDTVIDAESWKDACKAARLEFNKESHYTVVKVERDRMEDI